MRLHIVNPNTSQSMTAKIAVAARAVALNETVIDARQPAMGPASIEGYYDEAFAVPGMLGCIRDAERDGADAHIIACFDDTGLDTARAAAKAPVIGIGEAAFLMASLVAVRFSVVTTLDVSIVPIERNLRKYGMFERCARVRAAEIPVLDLEDHNSEASSLISAQIAAAIREDRTDAIVLGCAGMTDLAAKLSTAHGLPVVDGVTAAVTLAEGLVRLGLRTSRLSAYAFPRSKTYSGMLAGFQP